MGVTLTQFVKKPLYVEAVRITRKNFNEVSQWCSGRIQTEQANAAQNAGKKYLKIDAHNPINARQTKAFIGDWILRTERGFKIYTHNSFVESFDEVQGEMPVTPVTYPHEDGDFTVIGPGCFSAKDRSVLNWEGVNYVPQDADRSVESEVADFDDELDSCAIPGARVDPTVPQ